MKKKTFLYRSMNYLLYFVLLGLIPLLSLSSKPLIAHLPETNAEENSETNNSTGMFTLYDDATNQELKVSAEDYMLYATACEMPISYEPEALKAQAIAAHTYLLYRAESTKQGEAILHVNTENYIGYTDEEKLRAFWGENFDIYFNKLKDAVLPVVGQKICYENKPILAAYFAVSSGQTEDSGLVWGNSLPYLQPVEIGADLKSDHYQQVTVISQKNVADTLKKAGISAKGQPKNWFQNPAYSASSTLLNIEIGDRKITGQKLRTLFSLPSASIRITFEKDEFSFVTFGYGHDVGLSQFGANELAKAGMNHEEILKYFYQGVEIVS